jgi:uncharacterized protein YjbI with pentapeptide repeats
MDAQELIRRYRSGERDFGGADLEGANLIGVDLHKASRCGRSPDRASSAICRALIFSPAPSWSVTRAALP